MTADDIYYERILAVMVEESFEDQRRYNAYVLARKDGVPNVERRADKTAALYPGFARILEADRKRR